MLRDYQLRAKRLLAESYRKGHRRILVTAPTGSGKGVMLTDIIEGAHGKNHRVLFLVHRRELVYQVRRHLDSDCGLVLSGEKGSFYSQIQLATIQTLWRRRDKRPAANLVIVDEAHHVGAKTYNSILASYPEALVIGYTATPARKTGLGLGDYFTDLIQVTTVKELTEQGWLVPVTYMAPNVPDLSSVRVRNGDYVEPDLERIMGEKRLIGHTVGHYAEYAAGRKGIVFASGVAHSRALCDQFNQSGIRAAHLDAGTDRSEREIIENAFREGSIQVICNCQVYTEGIDVPDCSCIVLARPTKSLTLYLQMAGRGLRPANGVASGDEDCLLIDHSGSVFRHGPIDEDHEWSLDTGTPISERDQKKKTEKREIQQWLCAKCGLIFSRSRTCPRCGFPLPQTAKPVEYVQEKLRSYSPAEVKERAARARNNEYSKEEKLQAWRKLLHEASYHGRLVGSAAHKYKATFGVFPRNMEYYQPHSFEWRMKAKDFLLRVGTDKLRLSQEDLGNEPNNDARVTG